MPHKPRFLRPSLAMHDPDELLCGPCSGSAQVGFREDRSYLGCA
jgi:hypothetical protein